MKEQKDKLLAKADREVGNAQIIENSSADQTEDFLEEFDEEDEAAYLKMATGDTRTGGNQISQANYAGGPKTEHIKKPCVVVMVAEKPSIALSITEALSNGKYSQDTGFARSLPIYTFNGTFKGHQASFKVTSVAGHVFNRDFPTQY